MSHARRRPFPGPSVVFHHPDFFYNEVSPFDHILVKAATLRAKPFVFDYRELMAAITALTVVHNTPDFSGAHVTVNIDSQYVKNGITTWIKSWKAKGWKTADKKPVKNQDLWVQLDSLNASLNVTWNWVKGHAGVEYNEVCDQLCQAEIAKFE